MKFTQKTRKQVAGLLSSGMLVAFSLPTLPPPPVMPASIVVQTPVEVPQSSDESTFPDGPTDTPEAPTAPVEVQQTTKPEKEVVSQPVKQTVTPTSSAQSSVSVNVTTTSQRAQSAQSTSHASFTSAGTLLTPTQSNDNVLERNSEDDEEENTPGEITAEAAAYYGGTLENDVRGVSLDEVPNTGFSNSSQALSFMLSVLALSLAGA